MILTRYNNTLKVQVGNSVSYLDLYRYQTVSYLAGYTSIEVTTGNGSALVRFMTITAMRRHIVCKAYLLYEAVFC